MDQTLTVFDPAMCCSTGVCGPEVDPMLVQFSADLDWLAQNGVTVTRFNLAQEPGAFAAEIAVKEALGDRALPTLVAGGRTLMSGAYPTRRQLAGWFGLVVGEETRGCCSPKTGCC